MKPYVSYYKDLIDDLKNPKEAVAYLNAALESGDKNAFLLALRNVAEAQGGMSRLARLSKLHRVSLYKMLSKQGNPGIENLIPLLNALGASLQVVMPKQPLKKAA